uniref:Uncharacterized protein n=1 Tax=Physcomitrium patens TaxID=3218 RepID=A0A2K1IFM7_PHYPA|nr:hypothetical protein PHYPA_028666 [Physcomitrium patens]
MAIGQLALQIWRRKRVSATRVAADLTRHPLTGAFTGLTLVENLRRMILVHGSPQSGFCRCRRRSDPFHVLLDLCDVNFVNLVHRIVRFVCLETDSYFD